MRPLAIRLLLCGLGSFSASNVHAHFPVMTCEAQQAEILCDVGFSDGSKAIGKPVRLFDYQEQLLEEKRSDRFSRVRFQRPQGEFYLQFDSGHEFPIEVDYGEL